MITSTIQSDWLERNQDFMASVQGEDSQKRVAQAARRATSLT